MKQRLLYRILVLTHRFANRIATAGWPGCERSILADARGEAGQHHKPKCRNCGLYFVPSYGEFSRCQDCVASSVEAGRGDIELVRVERSER